jgi:hypothetical protein
MTMSGITQEGVARAGVSIDTLQRHYREELDTATDKAVAKVAGSLFQKAMGDGPQSAACAMFFLKTRGKWRENNSLTVGGDPEAGPVKIERVYSWRMRPAAGGAGAGQRPASPANRLRRVDFRALLLPGCFQGRDGSRSAAELRR